jgi:hypothetical protein
LRVGALLSRSVMKMHDNVSASVSESDFLQTSGASVVGAGRNKSTWFSTNSNRIGIVNSVSLTKKHSNWQSHLYAELSVAIDKMMRLSDDHDFYLEKEAGRKALSVLAFVRENIAIDPPKIINQSGEAVSFTWSFGDVKQYLTVAEDEVDLLLFKKSLNLRCEESLSTENYIDWSKILLRLGGAAKVTSGTED